MRIQHKIERFFLFPNFFSIYSASDAPSPEVPGAWKREPVPTGTGYCYAVVAGQEQRFTETEFLLWIHVSALFQQYPSSLYLLKHVSPF
jgi:hypothetical protein